MKAFLRGEGLSVKTTGGISKSHIHTASTPSESTASPVSFDATQKYESTRNVFHPFHCSPHKNNHKIPICCMPSDYQADENYTFSHCGIALDFTLSARARVEIKIASIVEHNLNGKDPLIIELSRKGRVYLVIKGSDTDEKKLAEQMDQCIIFPQIDAIRNDYEEEERLSKSLNLLSCSSLSTTTSTTADTNTTSETISAEDEGYQSDGEMSVDSEGGNVDNSAVPETTDSLPAVDVPERIMLCIDGKGEPLEARMSAFENDDVANTTLPSNVSQVKYHRSSTALFAFNDTSDFHSNLKSNIKTEKDIIVQGDEGRLPLYMKTVDEVFKSIHMKPSRRHTYFKFLANFEHWVESAGSYGVLKEGIRKCGIWPFSLWQYLSRFSGSSEITQDEYDVLVDHFPHLVDVAFVNGFVDPSFVEEALQDFISHIHYKTLPKSALELLKDEALKKQRPFSERNLKYWGCTHINNANVLKIRSEQRIKALDDVARISSTKKRRLFFNALKVISCVTLPASAKDRYNSIKGRNAQELKCAFIGSLSHYFIDERTYLSLRCLCSCSAKQLPFAKRFCPITFAERRAA